MTTDAIMIIVCIAALLVLLGALIGSELQVRLQESQRRRTAAKVAWLNDAHRARWTAPDRATHV